MPGPANEERPQDAAGFTTNGNLHGSITCLLGIFFTALLQGRGYVPDNIVVTLLGAVIGFFTGRTIARMLFNAGAGLVTSVYSPSGETTKYTPTYSHIEALEVRGELDAAADAWDAAVAENPGHVLTLVRAGDFQLRLRKDPSAALERYQRARALGGGADAQRYVQQKIVDLYLGPLADDGRAMVELRRLIEGFPGTREAEGARAALAEIKARRAES